MKINHLNQILLVGVLAFAAIKLSAAEEQDLIGTLQSGASAPQKWAACQRLRMIGTVQAVPALANLLTDERLSQAARYTLEGLTCPEANAALREALGRTAGLLKAGIIDSIGWRGDSGAVPQLASLLSDANTAIAAASAGGLGRIGGADAAAALNAVRDQAPAPVQSVVLESLLKCAERFAASRDHAAALAIYRSLSAGKYPVQIHIAAWRGLVQSDGEHRTELVVKALSSNDRPIKVAALKILRELNDPELIQAALNQWPSLSSEAQLAVLDAQVKLGAAALPTARRASQSPDPVLRAAAWRALGELNDAASIAALAKVAAEGEPVERAAARESLERIHGPGVRETLLARISSAAIGEKVELLRALGERDDRSAVNVLLENATSDAKPVRTAAIEALRRLAPPEATGPLLEIAARSTSDEERAPVLRALNAICESSPNKEDTARNIVAAVGHFPVGERKQLLPLLAVLGTADALGAAQTASRDQDLDLAKEGVRVLAQWPNAAPATQLLELARTSLDPALQSLAVRSAVEVAGQEPDLTKRWTLLQQALAAAKRPEEKRQALGQIGQVPTPEALEVALNDLAEPDLRNEAALAAVTIAEKLARANPTLGDEVATKVLAQVKEGAVARRAWALRAKPSNGGSFIRDWVVCGPYRQAGVVGAVAVFDIPFGPEKPGEKVEWKTMPRADHANLSGVFPGEDNCAAYLRTFIVAPQARQAVLLMGSDDGVKAWLNGKVVHSHNVDRFEVVDQDAAPITLVKGTNDLMLKITQGGGGWSACARIVGTDGKPISGLAIARPTAAPQATAASAPKPAPVPTPAKLPPHDAFRKLRLSDQFYAEGAYYGDFNRDGKMDIVAGPFWFEGPDFQTRHEYRPAKTYDPKGYSDNFLTYTGDFNGDGWTDVLCVPFPGSEGYWYENPKGNDGPWNKHLAYPNVGNESPMWGDVNGDGRPELVFCKDGYLGYAGPDLAKPDEPWVFHAVSTKNARYQRFTHGVGFGDINGDKRVDILESAGWWEQPAEIVQGQPWTFHPFRFAQDGAQMLVYDVNGDGLADVITTWHCHEYGMVWWQQVRGADGQIDWKQHVILSPTPDVTTPDFRPSQMHALDLVDMNGDGLMDVLTGKRFWSHGPTGDKEPSAPAIVFWLELQRDGQGGAKFVPHLIDDDSGVGTQVAAVDLNGDGKPDVVVGNKKGIFIHFNERTSVR